MPINTNIPLASYTVSGANLDGPTGVTFNLPAASAGYTDIVIRANIKTTAAAIILGRFNGDSASNYQSTQMGNGPGSGNGGSSGAMYFSAYAHATTNWGSHTYNIMNYANSTTRKPVLARGGNSTYGVDQISGSWNATPTPITSVTIFLDRAENFVIGTTFTVYGIAAQPLSAKATGGAIYSDADYFYHVFSATGTFTPLQSLTADVLVVAGGGGGGCNMGGGGGAGGVTYYSSQSLTTTGYTCTVGAGGAFGNSNSTRGTSGGNSQFGGLTASVGGGGGGSLQNSYQGGLSGGSGGGGAGGYDLGTGGSGGTATAGQGYAGGAGASGSNGQNLAGGGGGGAGAVGTAGSGYSQTAIGGNGGVGISTYSSWGAATGVGEYIAGSYYIAGGGGGGTHAVSTAIGIGGYGGGGSSGMYSPWSIASRGGLPTCGGGGGGGTNGVDAANGGSGVVIVRYAK